MLIIQLLICLILSAIFIQDLKDRSVYWFWFPLMSGLFILETHLIHRQSWIATIVNLAFFVLQLLLVTLYFAVKQKQWVNITKGLLGLGDILFLISIAFYLSVLNYFIFYIASLMFILIGWPISRLLFKINSRQIPLAGLQAVILIVFLIIQMFDHRIDLTDDQWLLRYLYFK